MKRSAETLEDFYRKTGKMPEGFNGEKPHFNLFKGSMGENIKNQEPVKYTRKDFYKIALIKGNSYYYYGEKRYDATGNTLAFFNPVVPYTWAPGEGGCTGYFCIFNDAFFSDSLNTALRDMPVFIPGNKPSFELEENDCIEVSRTFEKIYTTLLSDYRLKFDLIRNYIVEILHTALRIQESAAMALTTNANSRLTSQFIALLERQFPIETPQQQLGLRSASDYAQHLAVHVNSLNRAIRETTGKTTSNLIAERVTSEAKALLKHTKWNISEISFSLGFEDIAHFGNFFKKQTLTTPTAYRSTNG